MTRLQQMSWLSCRRNVQEVGILAEGARGRFTTVWRTRWNWSFRRASLAVEASNDQWLILEDI